MSMFEAYAKYYDLLYRDKDYAAETDYVVSQLSRLNGAVQSVLELGCGTGGHAGILAERGFSVHGVDRSDGMLAAAERRRERMDSGAAAKFRVSAGDVRSFRIDRKFDAVISLFHVFSYQTSNEDLGAVFDTAKAHLAPGGLLFFDCWYGPAVLTIGPSVTVKRFDDDTLAVTRIAEPTLDINANTVEVNYDIIVTDKSSKSVHRLTESHRMRYLFVPEIKAMCANSGLHLESAFAWMASGPPTSSTWAACFVARH